MIEDTCEFTALDSAQAFDAITASGQKFYVYVLLRPDGKPFYVGKGLGRRLFNHESEARNTTRKTHKLNTIRALMRRGLDVSYAIPHFCENEAEAHAVEVEWISRIGRHDLRRGPLTNQTNGGEGITGLSQETMARKAANLGGASEDPDRRVANEFFHNIAGPQNSVPIKPLGARRLEATTPHPSSRIPTERMAKAIVAGALATQQLIVKNLVIPRQIQIENRPYVIENGVARDMLKAEMINIVACGKPEDELFTLTALGVDAVVRLISRPRLEDLGVLEPLSG